MRVLISGASVAGPVLAYWLSRYGFTVTVVERAPVLRKAGGHAVDLFKPAMDIAEKMCVVERIGARKTGTDVLEVYREGRGRPYEIEVGRLMSASVIPSRRSQKTPAASTSRSNKARPVGSIW